MTYGSRTGAVMSEPISSRVIAIREIHDEATEAAALVMKLAEECIKRRFGPQYAATTPAMLDGYVQACATVYQAARIGRALDGLADSMSTFADAVATRLDSVDDAVDGLLERERGEHVAQ